MGTIADKFQLLLENKADIRAAILEKGQSIPATAPLSDYGDKIRAIQAGADTSDATATAGDILSGKTAYVNGGKVTGAMPAATQATPSVNVSSGGLITASADQEAGYVSAGTKSATKQLATQGAKTVTPGASEQTVVASGVYTTGAVKVAAIPAATQATPSINVSPDGLITASATQAAGYVSAGTKSATQQLSTQAGTTITPDTSRKTAVASGRFTTGNVFVAGDDNLIAENIKKGVSIFDVTGSYEKEWSEVVGAYQSGNNIVFEDIAYAQKIREFVVIASDVNVNFWAVISTFIGKADIETSGILPETGRAGFFENYNISSGTVSYRLFTHQVSINPDNGGSPVLSRATQFLLLYKI